MLFPIEKKALILYIRDRLFKNYGGGYKMKLKHKLGILILGCAVIGVALYGSIQKEPYSTGAVVDSVWDKYDVQSTQIGEFENQNVGKPGIYIDVYNEEEIQKVEKYLVKNLSKEDLEKYEIDVFLFEE